ncbi:cullin-3-like [Schistocerca cancellata]|uniref:cullin-3-like n=1 Tax=Schistocerca cancellata TaxID=274614 RepID=UPI002117CB7B|nr:cullin-3-like [Schistocerca cancellata]
MSALWLRYPSGSLAGGVTSFMSAVSVTEQCKVTYWNAMKNLVQEILNGGYQEFNRDAFEDEISKVILLKNSKFIYDEFVELLGEFLEKSVTDIISEPVSPGLLKKLIDMWLDYKTHLIRIRRLLKILDRIVFYENEKYNIISLGANMFCEKVVLSNAMRSRIQNVIMELLMNERKGQIVDRMTLKKFCVILKCFSQRTYKKVFEEAFLQKSQEFYKKEAQRLLLCNDAGSYLKGVQYLLKREKVRINFCLLGETQKRNIDLAEEELIRKFLNTVINMDSSGLAHMLKTGMYDDITLMYTLIIRVKGGLHIFADSLCLHLQNYWETLLKNECFGVSNYEEFITCLFCLKDQLSIYITQCFNNNTFLKQRTFSVFRKVINKNRGLAESLALYVHSKLCANTKSVLSSEKDKLLHNAIDIFRMLHDKDVFKYFYTNNLSHRLLHNMRCDDGNEEFMIFSLMSECYTLTCGMKGMVKDMFVSARLKENFNEYKWHLKKKLNCPEIHVRVLTQAYWPFPPKGESCIIPCRVHNAYGVFKKFYEAFMKGRRLVLLPQFGTCEIISHFSKNVHLSYHPIVYDNPEIPTPMGKSSVPFLPSKSDKQILQTPASLSERTCIVTATTYQMCILVLFNKYRELTFEEIQKKTGIPHNNLKFALHSLSGRNTNNLLKKETVKNTETYQVNKLFSPLVEDVNIMRTLDIRDTEAEERHLSINRLIRLDTVIAQIMRTRKTLPFHLIVSEVRAILRTEFQPSSIFILRRIESLIERKILKHKENSCNIYSIC